MSSLLENFAYARPTSFEQLNDIIAECQKNNSHFAFSAGGTNLIPRLKTQSLKIDKMISLKGLQGLNVIKKQDDRIIIGALTSLNDVVTSALIQEYLPALAAAAHKVASPQIRNCATIGGNIMVDNRCIYIDQSSLNRKCHDPCFKADGDVCHLVKSVKKGDDILCQARFVSDTAPVLLLLSAKITIVGPHGCRKIDLSDLYLKDGISSRNLQAGEIITQLDVPIIKDCHIYYEKLAIRNALDFPSLGVAVKLTNGDLSVALTGLNTHPGIFMGKLADYENFDEMRADICAQAMRFAKSYQQDFFPRAYRKSMIPVFITRGIAAIQKGDRQ